MYVHLSVPHRLPALLLALTLGLAALPASAQESPAPSDAFEAAPPTRAPQTFYLKPQLGLNTYAGDRSPSGLFASTPGPSTGLEVGYRRRLGAVDGALGLYFLAGRYPGLAYDRDGATELQLDELERWRHTLSLVGQIGFLPEARVSPYVRLGAGTTGGATDGAFRLAFSPMGGLGVDVSVTEQVGLFVEATGILSLPDRQFDWAADLDDRPADGFGFLGGGVRIDLGRPFVPVRASNPQGPTRLGPDEAATFTAQANEDEATGPVTYRWTFGDGTTAEGRSVTHRFDEPGNYTIELTASNARSRDTRLLTVTVTDPVAEARVERADATDDPVISYSPPPDTARDDAAGSETSGALSSDSTGEDADRPDVEARQQAFAVAQNEPVQCTTVVDLNAAYFEEDSAELTAEGRAAARENVAVLQQCPALEVRLDGYAAPGEATELAAARARTVRDLYVRNGVDAGRIVRTAALPTEPTTTKYGGASAFRRVDSTPVAPSATPSAAVQLVTPRPFN